MKIKYRSPSDGGKHRRHPFRAAVLRGLGVVAPPLFTVLIFVWVISATYQYVLAPVTSGGREVLVWMIADIREGADIREDLEPDAETAVDVTTYRVYDRVNNSMFVPRKVPDKVKADPGEPAPQFVPRKVLKKVKADPGEPAPQTAEAVYRRYVELTYLRPYYSVPFVLAVFVILLYLLGKFMAAGIGRFFWNLFERGIHQLPLIRNVYSSVKQVSDFLFTEREIEYARVVAIEYPRKGIWSLGMVTGESMLDIRSAAKEPVLSVLIPTSPMPVTGYTLTVAKSETIDLNITIEQAFQFIVSCGVVVPPQQLQQLRQSAPEALPQPAASEQ